MWLFVIQLTLYSLTFGNYFQCPKNEACVIDCNSNHNNFTCNSVDRSIINATNNVTSLSLICYTSSCNNLQIECPYTTFINITGSLKNSTINANNAQQLNINTQQQFINNNIYINNISSFNLQLSGNSQNNIIYAQYANQLQINMKQTNSIFDTIYANNATTIIVNTENNNISDTYIHAIFAKRFKLTLNNATLITNSIFYLNFTKNITVSINDNWSSFSDNILNMLSSNNFIMINKGKFLNNSIYANNITSFTASCIESCSHCDGIWNILNAKSVTLNMDTNINNETSFIIFNGIINASNATNMNINIGQYTSFTQAKIDATNASVSIIVAGEFESNTIIASRSKIFNINTDYGTYFAGNNMTLTSVETVNIIANGMILKNIIHGQHIKKQLSIVINGEFIGNILKLDAAGSVLITNRGNYSDNIVFGDNIKQIFNLTCIDNFDSCSSQNDIYNLKHTHNISLFINSTRLVHTYFTDLTATYSKYFDIYIGRNATINTDLNVMNAYKVLLQIDGNILNSIIAGNNIGNNLTIICNGTDFIAGGCHNLTVHSSPTYNWIQCIKYGCKTLNIFTQNDADDIDVTGTECPCKDDVINSCIDEWKFYCKPNDNNQYLLSIFDGGKKCNGICCGNVVNMLHEDECIWPANNDDSGGDNVDTDTDTSGDTSSSIGKMNNGKWVIPLIIGSIIFLLIASIGISVFFWYNKRQQKKRDEKVNKMEFVSVSKLSNDTVPTTNSPRVKKPKQRL